MLVINNYQVTLYAGLGLSGWMPLMLYGVYTTWAAILNYCGAMIVDRIGRVRMLSIGMVRIFLFEVNLIILTLTVIRLGVPPW